MFKMFKKATWGIIGALVIVGLLFGSKSIPYVQTAFNKVRSSAESSVPVTFQIDAAKAQLSKIDPEIKNMVWQIAKEKAQVKKLAAQLEQQSSDLEKQYDEMMTLRQHVSSGEQFYVGTNGKAYTSERVEEDLRHRFTMYQTAEKTKEKCQQILAARESSLESALAQLEEAKSQQRELEVQVENLMARNRMNEVASTAHQINIDNSQLSKTRQMIEDIDARLAAEEEMLNLVPKYSGQIPVNTESVDSEGDILNEMDTYFNKAKSKKKSSDAKVKSVKIEDKDLVSVN